ncbi:MULTISPECIES: universal stress protein [unclassified Streptomyces]|uniref:universal stress protein n=1 Tax=unclassified Streptomyces TaxID=2593676 RepID=UPI000DC78B2B|nr:MULTISPECIES: universal stress protein [unclassified Streptomyces]AWZ03404.1 universal stress protein [Streptomyces sp. ICC4]AWZ14622.1 universal stress protein [Streptomyces sp. ICC1]
MEGSITAGPELGTVIVGVDGSDPARGAALWAAAEAARRGKTLHIVHAADTDSRAFYASVETIERVRAAGRELLDDTAAAVADLHPDLHVTTEFSRSAAVPTLRRAAGLHGTVVVGNRGLGGFTSLMLGSVGLKAAASATTPFAVVRGTDPRVETGSVLAGVRDEHDLDCVRYAACEAELRKASLWLLHVWNPLQSVGNVVSILDDVEEISVRHAQRLTAMAGLIREEFPDLTVHADLEKSFSVAGVLAEASQHADLLVVGGRRSPGYIGRTLGHANHSLLHHARCPVLLIPRHGNDQGSES